MVSLVDENEQQKADLESEWSIKRTLIRLIFYPICLLMIIGGILVISSLYGDWYGWFLGIGLMYFAVSYLYVDIRVIVQKSRKKQDDSTVI